MKSARFVPAARREFLAEVVYYNREQAGLGPRFTAAGIVIFAVAHQSRHPDYWASRIQDR